MRLRRTTKTARAVCALLAYAPVESVAPTNAVEASEAPPSSEATVLWRAPAECPSQDNVESSIRTLVGRLPSADEMTAVADVAVGELGWQLTLVITTGSATHEQVLHAAQCRSLAEATALLVAVVLDPISAADTVARAQEAETTKDPPEDRPEPPPDDLADGSLALLAAPTPPSTPRWRLGIRLGLGGEFGAVPHGTGGVRFGLSASRGIFEVRVVGSYWLPRRTGDGAQAGARVQLGTAAVSPCIVPSAARLQFPLCAGLELGGLRGGGVGVSNAQSPTIVWIAATAGPGVRWWVRPRLALWADAEAFAPLAPPQLTLNTTGAGVVVHKPEPVGFRGLLGTTFIFRTFR